MTDPRAVPAPAWCSTLRVGPRSRVVFARRVSHARAIMFVCRQRPRSLLTHTHTPRSSLAVFPPSWENGFRPTANVYQTCLYIGRGICAPRPAPHADH
eukprot:3444349-Prymnesium_polylepis.1